MTALSLLNGDRTGAIVEKGIKGETRSLQRHRLYLLWSC